MAGSVPTRGRGIRRFTLGSGPLKRSSDRLEFLSRIVLVMALLTGIVVALSVATAVSAHGRHDVMAQAAERQQVSARLLEDPSVQAGAGEVTLLGQAAAIWTAPSGEQRTGPVPARVGAKAGSTVLIWVERDGDRTSRPLGEGDLAARAFGAGFLTLIGISAVALGAHLVVVRLLNRSRSRRWAHEWSLVGPRWSGRVP